MFIPSYPMVFVGVIPWDVPVVGGPSLKDPVDPEPSEETPGGFPHKRHRRLAARCRAGRSRRALAWPPVKMDMSKTKHRK